MTINPRILALVAAVSVNLGALAVMHAAMQQIAAREQIALSAQQRIVVTAKRASDYQLARQTCTTQKVL